MGYSFGTISNGVAVDVTALTEHQAFLGNMNTGGNFVNLMNVNGKGVLNEAILMQGGISTIGIEMIITIDGNIVYYRTVGYGGNSNYVLGIVQNTSILYNGSSFIIAGSENLMNSNSYGSANFQFLLPAALTSPFPNASQIIRPLQNASDVIVLNQPLYFKSSLLIQVKGTMSSGFMQCYAKARY